MDKILAQTRATILPGGAASAHAPWQPALLLRGQSLHNSRRHPVLYVHGATFPSASSMMFRFDGVSWADVMNDAGFSIWALDFAGFGGSDSYPEMSHPAPPAAEPNGRAPEAAAQIERAVRAILAETGAVSLSIVAHSWGTMAAGLFATQHPELVDRLVFFGPVVRREILKEVPAFGPWRLVTVEEQYKRFTEDVPSGHPPVLLDRHFESWSASYLASDTSSGSRTPLSVKTPNGPMADIMAAWSGKLAYDPSLITSPLAVVRGEWDNLCQDADAAWLLAALTACPEKQDIKIRAATHLMHLETARTELYRACIAFLQKQNLHQKVE